MPIPVSLLAAAPKLRFLFVVNVTLVPAALATARSSQLPTLAVAAGAPCRLISSTSSPATRQPASGAAASVAPVAVSAVTLNAGDSAHVRPGVIGIVDTSTLELAVTGARHAPRVHMPAAHVAPSVT